jgi:hypothetical protein
VRRKGSERSGPCVLRPKSFVLTHSTPTATVAEHNRSDRGARDGAVELKRMQARESRRAWRSPGAIAVALTAALAAGFGAGCHRRVSRPPPEARTDQPRPLDAPRAAARAERNDYVFTAAEQAAIDEFLGRHSDLRVATDQDRRGNRSGDGDVRGLYGIYHPYFVRGDLNDDGILDFVLAFVHRSGEARSPWFSVVVFTGLGAEKGFAPGSFLEREISLARGDLSIDRDAILVTPDLSDDSVRRYRWDPVHRSFVFVRDDEEGDDAPAATQT